MQEELSRGYLPQRSDERIKKQWSSISVYRKIAFLLLTMGELFLMGREACDETARGFSGIIRVHHAKSHNRFAGLRT
jgi:hypothetical protein